MNFCDDCDDMLYIKIKTAKENKEAGGDDDTDTDFDDKLIYLLHYLLVEYD